MATQPSECNTNVKRPAAQATSVMFHPSPPSAAAIYALHSRRALSTHSSRTNLHLDSAKKSRWQTALSRVHCLVHPLHSRHGRTAQRDGARAPPLRRQLCHRSGLKRLSPESLASMLTVICSCRMRGPALRFMLPRTPKGTATAREFSLRAGSRIAWQLSQLPRPVRASLQRAVRKITRVRKHFGVTSQCSMLGGFASCCLLLEHSALART